MSKSAIENLHQVVDLLADEIGDGTLVIEREGGKDYALVSTSYLYALLSKAEAYDELTADPEEVAREQEELKKRFKDLF